MTAPGMLSPFRRRGIPLAGLILVLCCDSGSPPPTTPDGPVVASIELTPTKVQLLVGDTSALQWVARDKSGKSLGGMTVTFVSSQPSIVDVSAAGGVRAVGAGTATVTAQIGTISASSSVEVLPLETVADIRVFPMVIDVGQQVPLTFALLNPRGALVTGKTVTFKTSSPDVASVSSTGVVNGVGFGTATVSLTADTVTRVVTVRVKSWPQEPDGFTRATERDFTRLATSANDTTGLDGWDAFEEYKWPGVSIVQDPSAPHSPPSVLQASYPAGTVGGTPAATPGRVEREITPSGSLYLSVWVQLSANWYAHATGTNKVLYVWINGQPRFFLSAEGSNAAALSPTGRLQGTPDDVERGREALRPNVHGERVVPGKWQRWEVVLKANTPGLRDGEFHLWVDGVEVARYADVAYLASKDTQPWMLIDIEPIWGGAGDRLPAAQAMRFDHIYVSRKD